MGKIRAVVVEAVATVRFLESGIIRLCSSSSNNNIGQTAKSHFLWFSQTRDGLLVGRKWPFSAVVDGTKREKFAAVVIQHLL